MRTMPRSLRSLRSLAVLGALVAGVLSSAEANAATKTRPNGACTRAQRNTRVAQVDGSFLVCALVGASYRWRVAAPRHNDPCSERAKNYAGTSLDCVVVQGGALQWRTRGSIWNPFRVNEPVEINAFTGGRYRVVLTQWSPDVTEVSKSLGFDPTRPGVAFLAWRYEATMLSPGKAGNRASDTAISFAYARNDTTRELRTTTLDHRAFAGSQPKLNGPTCDVRTMTGFPTPGSLKARLETLAVGETGYDDNCLEVPATETVNVILEHHSSTSPDKSIWLSTYFTGTPR